MEKVALANSLVFVLVGFISALSGLDLKKWASWLYGLYGFLSGFWVGFLRAGVPLGLQMGALFAFAILYAGAMTRAHKNRYK